MKTSSRRTTHKRSASHRSHQSKKVVNSDSTLKEDLISSNNPYSPYVGQPRLVNVNTLSGPIPKIEEEEIAQKIDKYRASLGKTQKDDRQFKILKQTKFPKLKVANSKAEMMRKALKKNMNLFGHSRQKTLQAEVISRVTNDEYQTYNDSTSVDDPMRNTESQLK